MASAAADQDVVDNENHDIFIRQEVSGQIGICFSTPTKTWSKPQFCQMFAAKMKKEEIDDGLERYGKCALILLRFSLLLVMVAIGGVFRPFVDAADPLLQLSMGLDEYRRKIDRVSRLLS